MITDMALIMKAALKNPAAKEILSAKTYTIPETAYTSERNMTSGHKMVSGEFECEGVYAGKPGYTRLAQSTLVTAAKRDDVNLIAVVMKSDSGISYEDTSLLLDNAYAKINDWGVTGGFNVYHPRVTQIDDAGFTVTWDVGLDAVRAEFPVWIEYDSTDVLTKGSLEVTSDTISYHVSLSDHGGKNGVYTVQAYVYNASGESKVCSIKVLAGVGEQKGFVNWNGSTYYVHENGALGLQWQELEEGCYYFDYTTAQMVTGWVGSDTKFYLDPDGKLHTGWLELDGKKYYFDTSGVMLANTIASIDGTTYRFDSDGAATKTSGNDYTVEGKYVKVFDAKNNKYYYMEEEFLEHPGIADGKVSDLDLLAAVCDAEAGDQGVVGMEAVALCVLNCTIDQYKEFPSQIRYVVYQGKPTQYAVVTDGALLKRLKGQFEDRTNAYAAAKAAMEVFSNYVNHGTKRTLPGFKTKDFNYKFFMTPAAFKAQNLNFSKLEYEQYKGHVFFVDWISG